MIELDQKPLTDQQKREILSVYDEADSVIQILIDTFGEDDPKVKRAMKVFNDLTGEDPSFDKARVALMYARWCTRYPQRIGADSNRMPQGHCEDCPNKQCVGGFVLDREESEEWRPCHRFMPETHEHWQQETGYLYNRD